MVEHLPLRGDSAPSPLIVNGKSGLHESFTARRLDREVGDTYFPPNRPKERCPCARFSLPTTPARLLKHSTQYSVLSAVESSIRHNGRFALPTEGSGPIAYSHEPLCKRLDRLSYGLGSSLARECYGHDDRQLDARFAERGELLSTA
jgi:hypothetical protein